MSKCLTSLLEFINANDDITVNGVKDKIGEMIAEYEKMANPNMLRFGKYKGKNMNEVFNFDPAYLEWLAKQNFTSSEQKKIINGLFRNQKQSIAANSLNSA